MGAALKSGRWIGFIFVFLALFLPPLAYLFSRLARSWIETCAVALPSLFVLSFPLIVGRRARGGGGAYWEKITVKAAYLSMGLLSFLLVASLLSDISGWLYGEKPPSIFAWSFSFALFALGTYQGIFGLKVRQIKVPIKNPYLNWNGLRILQISDLHLNGHQGEDYVRKVVNKALALEFDLVAFTGDIGDGDAREFTRELGLLGSLRAKAPVFYVPGNHEVYWNFENWMQAFRDTGMEVLLNEGRSSMIGGKEVFIAGITDPACGVLGIGPDLEAASLTGKGSPLRILLSHRPDPAMQAAASGFQLQLSGHTHGGQFFPWTLVAAFVHRHSLGLYRVGEMWVYVSAGTGSWGPRLRLGTSPEITLLELYSEKTNSDSI